MEFDKVAIIYSRSERMWDLDIVKLFRNRNKN